MGNDGSAPHEGGGSAFRIAGEDRAGQDGGSAGDASARAGTMASEPEAGGEDHWIDERVKALYEADLEEPLPDDMQLLIQSITKSPSS